MTDKIAVAAFAAKFETMWNRPDNMTIAEAVASHNVFTRPAHHSH